MVTGSCKSVFQRSGFYSSPEMQKNVGKYPAQSSSPNPKQSGTPDGQETLPNTALNGVSPSSTTDNPTLVARIATSATQLSRDLLGAGPSSATSSLASSWANSEKSSSSAPASSSTGDGSAWTQPSRASAGDAGPANRGPAWNFRSAGGNGMSTSVGSMGDELSGYENGPSPALPYDVTSIDQGVSNGTDSWAQQFTGRVEGSDLAYRRDDSGFHASIVQQASQRSQEPDGAAVVSLLGSMAFSTDSETLDNDLSTLREDETVTANDLFGPQSLLPSERDIAQQMRASLTRPDSQEPALVIPTALGARSTADQANRLALHQFHPNTELLHLPLPSNPSTHALSPTAASIAGPGATKPAYVFSSASQRREWYEQWLSEWGEVLNGYAEDVWGPESVDMDAVSRARDAVAETQGKQEWWEDEQAVRRLGMVLGHLGLGRAGVGGVGATGKAREMARVAEVDGVDDGDPRFVCLDCGGVYGRREHVVQHAQWERRSRAPSQFEQVLERQTKEVESQWGGRRDGLG